MGRNDFDSCDVVRSESGRERKYETGWVLMLISKIREEGGVEERRPNEPRIKNTW